MSTVKVSPVAMMIVAAIGMIFASSLSACVIHDRSERVVSYPVRVGSPPPRHVRHAEPPAWVIIDRRGRVQQRPHDDRLWAEQRGRDRGRHDFHDHWGYRDEG